MEGQYLPCCSLPDSFLFLMEGSNPVININMQTIHFL